MVGWVAFRGWLFGFEGCGSSGNIVSGIYRERGARLIQ